MMEELQMLLKGGVEVEGTTTKQRSKDYGQVKISLHQLCSAHTQVAKDAGTFRLDLYLKPSSS